MKQASVFEHLIRVAPEDIDRLGHVNNVVYLRYAQEAATAHWYAAVPKDDRENMVWVVRRHEIDYFKPALTNDELTARTWIGGASGATMERFIEIRRTRDKELLASIRSVWVAVDARSLRPRRVTDQLRSLFEVQSAPADGS
jgi:acyl-CoA thioester hydrolase